MFNCQQIVCSCCFAAELQGMKSPSCCRFPFTIGFLPNGHATVHIYICIDMAISGSHSKAPSRWHLTKQPAKLLYYHFCWQIFSAPRKFAAQQAAKNAGKTDIRKPPWHLEIYSNFIAGGNIFSTSLNPWRVWVGSVAKSVALGELHWTLMAGRRANNKGRRRQSLGQVLTHFRFLQRPLLPLIRQHMLVLGAKKIKNKQWEIHYSRPSTLQKF